MPNQVLERLKQYDWPGNVRELENVMRKYLVVRDADIIVDDLRSRLLRRASAAMEASAANDASDHSTAEEPVVPGAPILKRVKWAKEQAETEAILTALNSTKWNRKQAAQLLKTDYKALLYKMKKLSIEP